MPDREKVIKELEGLRDICNAKSNMAIGKGKIAWAGHANAVDDAFTLLKEQEANMESVVRCKECKWYQAGIDINGKPFTRCNGDVRVYGHTMPDWFCADGERKEDR